jgi:hypothetical protein
MYVVFGSVFLKQNKNYIKLKGKHQEGDQDQDGNNMLRKISQRKKKYGKKLKGGVVGRQRWLERLD